MKTQDNGSQPSPTVAAYTPTQFAQRLGRSATYGYRLLYSGKVKAVTGFGRILIPATELNRVLSQADTYNPSKREARPLAA
jgi:hypothetical protein